MGLTSQGGESCAEAPSQEVEHTRVVSGRGSESCQSQSQARDLQGDLKVLKGLVTHHQVLWPAMYPVYLRRVEMDEWDSGGCSVATRKGKPCFVIELNKHDNLKHQCWALLHELGHATQWRPDRQEAGRQEDHDDEFGIHWVRAWNTWGENPKY